VEWINRWINVGEQHPVSTTPNVIGTVATMELRQTNPNENQFGARLRAISLLAQAATIPSGSRVTTTWSYRFPRTIAPPTKCGWPTMIVGRANGSGMRTLPRNLATTPSASMAGARSDRAHRRPNLLYRSARAGGWGGDSLALSWKLNDTNNPANGSDAYIISGSVLTPYSAPRIHRRSIAQRPRRGV
jgi:hypothetical protein